jgi:hypothetical protein
MHLRGLTMSQRARARRVAIGQRVNQGINSWSNVPPAAANHIPDTPQISSMAKWAAAR